MLPALSRGTGRDNYGNETCISMTIESNMHAPKYPLAVVDGFISIISSRMLLEKAYTNWIIPR
jgi:hypothetical protein